MDSVDWQLLIQASVGCGESIDHGDNFVKMIDIWRRSCQTVNRRLCGTVLISDEDDDHRRQVIDQCSWIAGNEHGGEHGGEHRGEHGDEHALFKSNGMGDLQVRKLIPKSDLFSQTAYELSYFSDANNAIFMPCDLVRHDGSKKNPQVDFAYRISLLVDQEEKSYLAISVPSSYMDSPKIDWLRSIVFPRLLRWFNSASIVRKSNPFHSLVDVERFAVAYRRLKDMYASHLVKELWNNEKRMPSKFVDVGCGNGLLVHLLSKERVNGMGIDVRRRGIWEQFSSSCHLMEVALDPSDGKSVRDCFNGVDWLIGNHSDELTPWIPVMAARLGANFFLLPCCPFDFYGRFCKRSRAKNGENSLYSSYLDHVRDIINSLGFELREDRLRIPSTKRHCFIGTIPTGGLSIAVERVIEELIGRSPQFKARPPKEPMRNCSNIPVERRKELVLLLVGYLLEGASVENGFGDNERMRERRFRWRRGKTIGIAELAGRLNENQKAVMRDQDGGLQTFLKNQYQIFQVSKGQVCLKDWRIESVRAPGRRGTSDCWFFKHHPDGCPLSDQLCPYRHCYE